MSAGSCNGNLYDGAIEVLKRLGKGEVLTCISSPRKVDSLPIKFTGTDRKTVNRRTVYRLLQLGYIECKASIIHNRKMDLYCITRKGEQLLEKIRKRHAELIRIRNNRDV